MCVCICVCASICRCVEVLARYTTDVDHAGVAGETPLYLASVNGSVECVRILLDAGADHTHTTNVSTVTFHCAIKSPCAVSKFEFGPRDLVITPPRDNEVVCYHGNCGSEPLNEAVVLPECYWATLAV